MQRREAKVILDNIDASYHYNFKSIRKNEFFKQLNMQLRRKLIFYLCGKYIQKFNYFFDDIEKKYYSSDFFKYGILSNMKCHILLQDSVIIDIDKRINHIFFVNLGGVNVMDRHNNFIVQYISGSNFGDFQVILGLRSQFKYMGIETRTSYLFSVKKSKFLKYLYSDYNAYVYITKVAL